MLLARLLVSSPQPEVRDLERGLELARLPMGDKPETAQGTVDEAQALAMALAAKGDFEGAKRWQEAAIGRIRNTAKRALASERLSRYRQNLPCRDPWPRGEVSSQATLVAPDSEAS